ncbi:sugar ABC transporter permease [Salinisphaera sp. USBA-960]|uniref:carbohydrate ABC transporter permease n=1 Tax=Salinisphaera orenii TaxID=856731 RepID=UPI000DBE39B2|nr:sugar ABC transporter permease [Salifodinibacter halophilus]NNC26864.1 sugar ABC transporter permease [Salifodinibacter halophilus]
MNPSPIQAAVRSAGQTRVRRSSDWAPYILSLPALFAVIGVVIPFGTAVYYSMLQYNLAIPSLTHFIWFGNYVDLFTSSEFWHTVYISMIYVVATVGLETILGLIVAMALARRTLVNNILSVLLILPFMVAPVIAALMWKLMTNSNFGVLNYFLQWIGIYNFGWASDPNWAMFTAVLVDIWVFTPFFMVLLLAGLRGLPTEPFEAAELDGVPRSFVFFRITLPMLRPYIITAVVFHMFDSIQQFPIPFGLTRGGPGDALNLFQVRAYLEAFTYTSLGKSAAILFVLWVITYTLSFFAIKYRDRQTKA